MKRNSFYISNNLSENVKENNPFPNGIRNCKQDDNKRNMRKTFFYEEKNL